MTDRELRERLQQLSGEVPMPTHSAYIAAVRYGKDGRPMKKKLRLTPVLVILLIALLAATAYAVVSRFSVTDYAAQGTPTEAFLNRIVTIDQTYENPYMTLTANDALYDGTTLSMAFDLTTKDENTHLYLHPRLTATVDGQTFLADVEGFGAGDFMSGFVYPFLPGHDPTVYGYGFGFDATLPDENCQLIQPAGNVEWTLTLRIYRPLYQVAYWDGQQSFETACENGIILVTNDTSIAEWENALPVPEGITEAEWYALPWWEHLSLSGAYELMDTVQITFTTSAADALPTPEPVTLRPGDQGEAVRQLQQKLMEQGLLQNVSGVYDPTTEEAVKTLQRTFGLVPDGIAGPDTLQALETSLRDGTEGR